MIIDRELALKRLDGNETLYQKMVAYFIRDYSDFPDRMEILMDLQTQDAYVLTHSLKNIAASLGAESLASSALGLESFLKVDDFESALPLLKQVNREFLRVKAEIDSFSLKKDPHPVGDKGTRFDDYPELLKQLAEGLGSFSPSEVEKAVKAVTQSWFLVPHEDKELLGEILTLSNDFRYLEGEEKLAVLLHK